MDSLKIGWREWVSLPDLGIPAIKAKIDTGAKTSTLHAQQIEVFQYNNRDFLRFNLQPIRRYPQLILNCQAPIFDQRFITDSGGHRELRYVIQALISIADRTWPIEITLTNRTSMQFRMLLGRSALQQGGLHIHPQNSYVCGKKTIKKYYSLPQ
ncbi:MAG: ATP-dependent zinc protease [Thiothrix sp.]|nr:MAG: ATP-dependent zinc protease [Thiothrix sp.]